MAPKAGCCCCRCAGPRPKGATPCCSWLMRSKSERISSRYSAEVWPLTARQGKGNGTQCVDSRKLYRNHHANNLGTIAARRIAV